jgi:hypothetical protein
LQYVISIATILLGGKKNQNQRKIRRLSDKFPSGFSTAEGRKKLLICSGKQTFYSDQIMTSGGKQTARKFYKISGKLTNISVNVL